MVKLMEKMGVYIQAVLLFGVLHLLAYLFSFQAIYEKTTKLQLENASSQQTIAQLKREAQLQKNKPTTMHAISIDPTFRPLQIESLFKQIQQSGLVLLSMTDHGRGKSPVTDIDHVRLQLQGSYMQLADLLLHLSSTMHVALVTNVTLKTVSENKCVFTIDVMLWQGVNVSENNIDKLNIAHDPMCASADELMAESVESVLAHTPRAQLKIIGSYQRAARKWLIVLLPDARLIDIPATMFDIQGKQ